MSLQVIFNRKLYREQVLKIDIFIPVTNFIRIDKFSSKYTTVKILF